MVEGRGRDRHGFGPSACLGRLPGLYAIRTDKEGRAQLHGLGGVAAAARDMLDGKPWGRGRSLKALARLRAGSTSPASRSRSSPTSRARSLARSPWRRRSVGGGPSSPSIPISARAAAGPILARRTCGVFTEALNWLADVALPSFADEKTLFGDPDPARRPSLPPARARRARGGGEGRAENPCLVVDRDGRVRGHRPRPPRSKRRSTPPAAGDSFDAAYLPPPPASGAPLADRSCGRRLTCSPPKVIRHRGAIMPRAAGVMH